MSRKSLLDVRQFRIEAAQTNDSLKLFRAAVKHGRKALHHCHINGVSASELLSLNSWLTDQIIISAWKVLLPEKIDEERSALVAVGGYGRSELHPHSDIDLMVLFTSNPNSIERLFVERYIRFLWDIGLQVGNSVRTLNDCVIQARKDVTVLTNLMESRPLFGNARLEKRLAVKLNPNRLWNVHDYFRAKTDEQLARHHFYNDTAYNLEPHIKEGPGGLRDIQTITWITQRHFGSRDFTELIKHEFLTAEEYRMLIRGRNFLWKLRNALHFLSKRREDRLLFDYQKDIAQEFGYKNDRKSLAVEKLMKRYYRTVKQLRFLNDLLIQYFQQNILSHEEQFVVDINPRFRSVGRRIETKHANVFQKQPFALLEIFLILQQHSDVDGIQAGTIRQLWSSRKLVDSRFRKDLRCQTLFMEILRSPSGQIHALRSMNDYGILGAYIPSFGKIVGQMQHDLFHFFTVDAHLLFVVRNLRRLEISNYDQELPFSSSLMATIYKRHRLFLAALFHDIAKGRGGDHSRLGEKKAYDFCRLHDLSEYDSKFVAWLVRHHLSMSWVAQREDISDPSIIQRFAALVGSQERLDNLYLLTIADIRGTSPYVWNDWKGQLLFDLYLGTSRALQRGIDAQVDLKEQVKDVCFETLNFLPKDKSTIANAKRYWETLDLDYFLRYRPEFIAWHTQSLLSTPVTELPLVTARPLIKSETAQFLVCAPDSDQLLSNITAGFDNESANIVDARVHKTYSGLTIMIFIVFMPTNITIDNALLDSSAINIRERLLNPKLPFHSPPKHIVPRLKHFPIETEVVFQQSPNKPYTIMEVTAQDRPGLLHQVANALLHCKVQLLNARVSTFGERAEDIFVLRERNGGKLTSQEQKDCLVRAILKGLP